MFILRSEEYHNIYMAFRERNSPYDFVRIGELLKCIDIDRYSKFHIVNKEETNSHITDYQSNCYRACVRYQFASRD